MAKREEFIQVLGEQIRNIANSDEEAIVLDKQMEYFDAVIRTLSDDELIDVANSNRHLTETYEQLADSRSDQVLQSALNLRKMRTQVIAAELSQRDIDNDQLSGTGWDVVDADLP